MPRRKELFFDTDLHLDHAQVRYRNATPKSNRKYTGRKGLVNPTVPLLPYLVENGGKIHAET